MGTPIWPGGIITSNRAVLLLCALLWVSLLAACRGEAPPDSLPQVEATAEATRSATVQLQGSVYDETLPHSRLIIWWALVSGPGPVVFADPLQVDTTATFTVPGTYVLRLTASDGEFVVSDDVTIEVLP